MSTQKYIQQAVQILGSQVALAREVGCNPTHIHQLLNGTKKPSAKIALRIENATFKQGKKVDRRRFRPKDWEEFWPELRGTPM